MKKRGMQVLLGALALAGVAYTAQAAVIDFESLAHDDDQVADHGAIYEEDGFRLTNTGAYPFATFGAALEGLYVGSTALINDNAMGTTVLTSMNGELFRLNSIDLAELFAMEEPFSVTFNGLYQDGSSVSQVFTLDGLYGAETFLFDTAFTNLVSVSWLQSEYFHQFDNINVAPVPEPSTVVLFGTGLLTLAAARRRRG